MKTAFITGATSGIGLAFAKELSTQGYSLILHGRNEEKLARLQDEIAGVVSTICLDLSQTNAHNELIERLSQYENTIDIAINNAGFGLHGAHCELPPKQVHAMISVNILALTHLSEFFAKRMEKQGLGYILNVASTAAYQPQPYMAAYAASKAYVASFSESLAIEMKNKGVSITCLSPGRTDTGFFSFNGDDVSSRGAGTFSSKYRVSPEKVAKLGLKALFKGKYREVPFLNNKFYVFLNRILPKTMLLKIYSQAMTNI